VKEKDRDERGEGRKRLKRGRIVRMIKVCDLGCWEDIRYKHTHICRYIHKQTHTCVCMHNVFMCRYIYTHVRTYIHAYIHTCIHTYIHTRTRTHIQTYTRAYIHTYIHEK